MTTINPDIQPAVQHTAQVAIAGAGPVGLMMANYLGQMGIEVLVVEKLDTLIDYPRAIGIDDEALRTMQSVGLVENVLPHTTPWHAMRFLTPKGRCFADIQPMTDERRIWLVAPQCFYSAAGGRGDVGRVVAFSQRALPVLPRAGGLQPTKRRSDAKSESARRST